MKQMNKPVPGARVSTKGVLSRILKMLYAYYPKLVPLTAVCILVSAATAAVPSIFTQKVIAVIQTWYESGDWASARAEIIPLIALLIGIYIVSVAAIAVYTQLMANITQGFLSRMRCAMRTAQKTAAI